MGLFLATKSAGWSVVFLNNSVLITTRHLVQLLNPPQIALSSVSPSVDPCPFINLMLRMSSYMVFWMRLCTVNNLLVLLILFILPMFVDYQNLYMILNKLPVCSSIGFPHLSTPLVFMVPSLTSLFLFTNMVWKLPIFFYMWMALFW